MKKLFKTVVVMALVAAFVLGSAVPAKASTGEYQWIDGYNMTFEEIKDWALSNSNGKTEKQNRKTAVEFTNFYVNLFDADLENGTRILCIEQKDEENSGWETVKRTAGAGVDAATGAVSTLDGALDDLAEMGLLKSNVKENEKVESGIGAIAMLNAAGAMFDAYSANRYKIFYVFKCDSKGNIANNAKPISVYATMLYNNHENDYKNKGVVGATSETFTFNKTKKPVHYRVGTVVFEEDGLAYWMLYLDSNNYVD